jgi:2-polyprenyl-3-methyl-5-hydroxy-6-metoxy-1,4-benzoquinol methylase
MHARLVDRLFGAAGEWSWRRCGDDACGVAWLDPVPIEEDLPLAYRGYYTHRPSPTLSPSQARSHGPCDARQTGVGGLAAALWSHTPIARARLRLETFLLDDRAPGRVLEIGCGSGERIALLRERGWEVDGQEIDAVAAAVASERLGRGATIRVGPLETLALGAASYDAVVSNHVLEHVLDPAAVLREARRLLKPDGVLVAITPNVASLGHRVFGRDWFYLDPPRHLQVFTPRALARLACEAGFTPDVRTTSARAEAVAAGSLDLRRPADTSVSRSIRDARAASFQAAAALATAIAPSSGEECVLVGRLA